MGLTESKGPNPNITDKTNPRHTELSNFNPNWQMRGLIGDAATFMGNGFEALQSVQKLVKESITAGDHVVIGNRQGMVTEVHTGLNNDDVEVIVGLTVNEDMRYLPQDYKSDPASFGYDDDLSKRNRTTVYNFGIAKPGQDPAAEPTVNTGESQSLDGQHVLYTGSILVLKQRTSSSDTWPNPAQDAEAYQAKF